MRLRESQHDSICILHLEGEIDLHYAPVIRAVFQAKAARRCPYLIADFSAVTFIDSTGIAVLIEYLRDATSFGGQFCIAGLTEHVRDVFTIVRLDKAIPLFDTAEDATVAFSSGRVPACAEPLFRRPAAESLVSAA